MNKFNIFDKVKIKGEDHIYKIYAIEYYHTHGIVYELWRDDDAEEFNVDEDKLELA